MEGDVYFTPDSVYSIEIQAQQNILDVIESPVEGGVLVLKIQDHTVLGKHDPIRIYIHAPSIKGLDVSGSGNISAGEVMHQPDLNYNISGSGNINVAEVKSKQLYGRISGSGNITGSSGTSDYATLTISGSGNLNFQDVMADTVYVTISGSGDVTAYAVKYLDVTISGSGNVRYNGNPIINQHISGSGNVARL
jgi:lipopolysaccharide export system protein LptA